MGREASFSESEVIREARKQPISLFKASSEDVQGFIRSHAAALIYSPKKIDTISINDVTQEGTPSTLLFSFHSVLSRLGATFLFNLAALRFHTPGSRRRAEVAAEEENGVNSWHAA